ncbi:hypothetical protein [Pontibacter anaerobius]|uniref:Uncharacterized protein n=1 Tax=Pontibacter anaerobius TaxID=2993940 RepID=A0ABT3RC88_9BACT|nr:hypothetical protein [Pontibacter anaerobius]MCX2739370.1 hypothetical protein [Pontibacter anaerobius]
MQISLNYRFLILLAVILAIAALFINGTLFALFWLSHDEIPLWGQQSIAIHLFAYSLATGFILGWIATRATRWALRNGKVLPLHWHLKSQTLIDRLPSKTFNRAFMFALAGVSIASIMVLLLDLLQLYYIPYADFQLLSSVFSICFSAAITIMAVYRGLGDKIMRHSKV